MANLSGIKSKIITNCLEKKLNIDFGKGRERNGWYCVEGKKILRVTVPKQHGSKPLSPLVAKKIMNSLRLTSDEFRNLYNCPMTGSDFRRKIDKLIKQGIL